MWFPDEGLDTGKPYIDPFNHESDHVALLLETSQGPHFVEGKKLKFVLLLSLSLYCSPDRPIIET